MKKLISFILSVIFISCMVLCGCNENKINTAAIGNNNITDSSSKCAIAVLDYKTGNTLTEFTVTDNNKETALTILSAVNYVEKTETPPTSEPDYIIHLIDKGDSQYDIWYNAYVSDGKLYTQMDTEKTKDNGVEITNEISKCTDVTPDEFLKAIS